MNELLRLLPRVLACFLIGSIPFAVLAMKGTGVDILRAGSRNPGFNNVLRYSKSRAIVTLIGDLGKGAAAILLFFRAGDAMWLGWLYGVAAVVGHCYSPFLKFNGGKGIATSAGVMLVLYPLLAIAPLTAFTILRVTGAKLRWTEAGAIASLASWLFFALLVFLFQSRQEGLYAVLTTAFLAWRHKRNFQILAGTVQPQL